MKKIVPLPMLLVLFLFVAPFSGFAGPFDSLKNLKIVPGVIPRDNPAAPMFQLSNFTLGDEGGTVSRWRVDLTIGRSIAINEYSVRTVFQNRRGETLFPGEEIPLPAGNERKIFHLSRTFQKDSHVSHMTFQLYNRAAGKIEDSRSFPLPAASFAAHDAAASVKAAVPRRAPGAAASAGPTVLHEAGDRGAHTDTALDSPFIFEDIQTNTETLNFRIQNRNNIPVKIGAVSAKAKFFDGFDHDLNISCSAAEIAPGQDVRCTSPLQPARCPTLHRIDVSAVLNGKRLRGEMEIDAPVKAVESEPVIRLKKRKMDNCCQYGNGSGEVEVIVRGVCVRLGAQVTMKGIVNFDGAVFPVVFPGYQNDDGISGKVEVVGTQYNNAPDTFCFRLMEITTCDDPKCGGAGAVIYRNGFNVSEWNGYVPWGNLFLLQRHCE